MGPVRLEVVLREWGRIGLTGFGGPPAHIALLRPLVTERLGLMDAEAFSDANATAGLLPGPASTQMAIFCAWRAAGPAGAIVGGLAFIVPAVVLVVLLSVVFLGAHEPAWVIGAGAGAGAVVPAVAVQAARGFLGPSLAAARGGGRWVPWAVYLLAGAAATIWLGSWVVLVLLGCGVGELVRRSSAGPGAVLGVAMLPPMPRVAHGGLAALTWTALKVGALSFGGGFVIIPLMQGDAVHLDHWMSNAHFLNAVALGQITPGPVVATVAAVGYAAHGVLGAVLAAVVAFLPSFLFVLLGGRRFEALRANRRARAFLDGAGPAAIGAILGAAVLLAMALGHLWQFVVLALALLWLLGVGRGVVSALLGGGCLGVVLALLGAAV